jgi:hypothetical protein
VEARLGLAVMEATSAEKPFACRCCTTTSTRADGIGRRCETDPPAESEGQTAEGVPTDVPHTDVAGVGTTLERATRGRAVSSPPLEWTEVSAVPVSAQEITETLTIALANSNNYYEYFFRRGII